MPLLQNKQIRSYGKQCDILHKESRHHAHTHINTAEQRCLHLCFSSRLNNIQNVNNWKVLLNLLSHYSSIKINWNLYKCNDKKYTHTIKDTIHPLQTNVLCKLVSKIITKYSIFKKLWQTKNNLLKSETIKLLRSKTQKSSWTTNVDSCRECHTVTPTWSHITVSKYGS